MADDNTKPDLAFVTTEELISELFDRCDAVVVMRIPLNEPTAGRMDMHGGFYKCLGLVTDAQRDILTRNFNSGPKTAD